jgi:hypothetical protein
MSTEQNFALHDSLPGLRLVDYKHIGLPVYLAHIDVLSEERRELHLVPEYCLRLIHAGVSRFDDLVDLLGLTRHVVQVALADLLRGGVLRGDEECLSLTSAGKELVSAYTELVCAEATWFVPYDGVLRKPYAWRRDQLLTGRQLQDAGHHTEFNPFGERPTARDLDINDVWQVLASMRPDRTLDRLISIRNVRRAPVRFVPAIALAYKGDKDMAQVRFLVDGRSLDAHNEAFALRDGLKRPAFRHLGDIDTAAAQLRATVKRRLARQRSSTQSNAGGQKKRSGQLTLPGRRNDTNGDVYVPPIYSMASKWSWALEQVENRLIVTSRVLSPYVANEAFMITVEKLLDRNVSVYIGLESGAIDSVSGAAATAHVLASLRSLQERSSLLHVRVTSDLEHTHLVVDDRRLIVGDYDWLAPDGAKSRSFRERWLLETEISEIVEREAQRLLARLSSE